MQVPTATGTVSAILKFFQRHVLAETDFLMTSWKFNKARSQFTYYLPKTRFAETSFLMISWMFDNVRFQFTEDLPKTRFDRNRLSEDFFDVRKYQISI